MPKKIDLYAKDIVTNKYYHLGYLRGDGMGGFRLVLDYKTLEDPKLPIENLISDIIKC